MGSMYKRLVCWYPSTKTNLHLIAKCTPLFLMNAEQANEEEHEDDGGGGTFVSIDTSVLNDNTEVYFRELLL